MHRNLILALNPTHDIELEVFKTCKKLAGFVGSPPASLFDAPRASMRRRTSSEASEASDESSACGFMPRAGIGAVGTDQDSTSNSACNWW